VLFNLLKKKGRSAVGVDLGHSGLKVAVLKEEKGRRVVENLLVRNFPPGTLLEDKILERENLVAALRDMWTRESLSKDRVVAGVLGRVRMKRATVSPMDQEALDRYLALEGESLFGLPFSQLVVDYVVLAHREEDMALLVVGVPLNLVSAVREIFQEAAVELHILDVAPLALYHLLGFTEVGDLPGLSLLIDVGKCFTTFVVLEDRQPIYAKGISLGGDWVTYKIHKEEAVPYVEAEAIKVNELSEKPYAGELVRDFVMTLARELQLSLGECKELIRQGDGEVNRILYTGGGGLLVGFEKVLQEMFDLEVKNIYYFISGEEMRRWDSFLDRCSVALGLALRGLV